MSSALLQATLTTAARSSGNLDISKFGRTTFTFAVAGTWGAGSPKVSVQVSYDDGVSFTDLYNQNDKQVAAAAANKAMTFDTWGYLLRLYLSGGDGTTNLKAVLYH